MKDTYESMASMMYETHRKFNPELTLPQWEYASKKDKGYWYSVAFAGLSVIENPSDEMIKDAVAVLKKPLLVPAHTWETEHQTRFIMAYKAAMRAIIK